MSASLGIDQDSQPYWDGCARGELLVRHCQGCGHRYLPPRDMCPHCHSTEVDWVPVPSTGTVYASTVCHHAFDPAWKDRLPYNISLVELDGGARLWTNVLAADPHEVRVGQRVRAVFQQREEWGIFIPLFVPEDGAAQ